MNETLKDTHVSFVLPKELADLLKREAARRLTSKGQVVREALLVYFQAQAKGE